jgi:hypothetical protein
METHNESQLNRKLATNTVLKLIIDDCSPKFLHSEQFALKHELISKLEMISEDRERVRKRYQELVQVKNGLVKDICIRKSIHEELNEYFQRKNERKIRELEIEAKVLQECYETKTELLGRMKGILDCTTKKVNISREERKKRSYLFESLQLKRLSFCESPGNVTTTRRQKVAVIRN